MPRVSIKLCGIRTVHDAVFCAAAGADELGVVFAKASKRRISIEEARAICDALPPALPLVGVFQDASLAEIEQAVVGANLSAVQLHGLLPEALFSPVFRTRVRVPIHLALQITGPESLRTLASLSGVRRILLDGPSAGSGVSFAWSLLREAREQFPGAIHLAGGLTPENVAEAIRTAAPDGVDVSSGIEGSDGFKDEAKARAFVRAVRAAS